MRDIGVSIIVAITMCSCSPRDATQPPPPEQQTYTQPINHSEIALLNLAHKSFGESNIYTNETISEAGGFKKVCGTIQLENDNSFKRRFIFSTDRKQIFSATDTRIWDSLCSNSWTPGQGQ